MCTAIRLTTTSGAVVYARTIDFAADARSDVIVVPRRYALMGMASRGEPGMTWTSTYAAVGVNTHGLPLLIDGVNERGLAVGALYHPGYADYQAVGGHEASRTLAPVDLPIWLLTRCASVEAAARALREVVVGASVFEPLGFVPPLHYVLHDTERRCVVVEFTDGKLMVHDNPLGIITNAPEFQWHVAHLRECVARSAQSGTLCLPGDFDAPSRFVRAAALSQAAVPVDTAEEAVQQAFHILGHCEIPRRVVSARGSEGARCDYTQSTIAVDTSTRRLYFHTYGNRRVRMVDLIKMRLEAPTLTIFPMDSHEDVQELIGP